MKLYLFVLGIALLFLAVWVFLVAVVEEWPEILERWLDPRQ